MDRQRVKVITQKRTTLKNQITTLQNLFDQRKINDSILKLRMARVTDLFYKFEELNDELNVLDPDNESSNDFDDIQSRYYNLASVVQIHLNPQPGNSQGENTNTR